MNVSGDGRLARLQAISGMAFGLFAAIHLVNTWLALGGPALYDGFQQVVRGVYQYFVIEALLLLALIVHAAIGIARLRAGPDGVCPGERGGIAIVASSSWSSFWVILWPCADRPSPSGSFPALRASHFPWRCFQATSIPTTRCLRWQAFITV